ncbi:unnamed protein product [Dovyalis caffra]|uniref:Uncharacterized protein n=1 Tax=Dovyalis caffra TaxID=77055 RepID=A0AAV1R3E9_9ROSI|nr:unnamed protein product [Dovyalis caffra]
MGSNRRVCEYEAAFKSMAQKRNIVGAESAPSNMDRANNNMYRISASGVNSHKATGMNPNTDEKRRKRREEKAETLLHLICWGPN